MDFKFLKIKKWLIVFLLFFLVSSITLPNFEVKADTEWQKLDREIQEIQRKKEQAAKQAKNTENQINNVKKEQSTLKKDIDMLNNEIYETEQKLFALEKDISIVTEDARIASIELDEAIKRVEERDQLLKTRVRLMYRKGDVEYLEVLLGSTSFTDFIQRFNALQKIVESDKKILQDNINDKNTIEQKKLEIDQALADLEVLYAEAEELRLSLVTKKDEKTVRIAALNEKEKELEDILQEEQEEITRLALKQTELNNELKKLMYGGVLSWPVPASTRITSNFGMRIDPINGKYKGHTGIDIGRAPGTDTLYGADIVAAGDGIVIVAQYVSGYGNTVMIDHGSGIWTLYGHIRNGGIFVKVGDEVKRGQKIAEVGTTGRSTGPHLHFEVRKNNVPVNPWDYLPE